MPKFISVHAQLLQNYIKYKRQLGYKFEYDYSMAQFDHFLAENNYQKISLDQEICSKWEKKRPNETDATRYQRVGLIHNYAIYLQKLGYDTCIPEHLYRFKTTFTPYIFTQNELERFFKSYDILYVNSDSPIYPTFFRLLYGCGLRSEEALNLKIEDIDFKEKIIYIRKSKNNTERVLPVSESVMNALLLYYSKYRSNSSGSDFLFVTKYLNRPAPSTVYHHFRLILESAKIPHGGKGKGPRIHDFRHTFSVHSLAKMVAQEIDLYCFLPILSKYLGHKSIAATEGYIRLTAEVYPNMMERINTVCADIYPEVYMK